VGQSPARVGDEAEPPECRLEIPGQLRTDFMIEQQLRTWRRISPQGDPPVNPF
jgi:hypothetical protein